MLNCTQKEMQVCLICSWHQAPLSSQNHLLPQLKFAGDLQTEPQKITSPQFFDQHIRKEDTFTCSWIALCFCSSCPCQDQLVPLVKPGNSHVRFSANTLVLSIPSILQQALDACIYYNDSFICKNFVSLTLSGFCVPAACLQTLSWGYQPRKL